MNCPNCGSNVNQGEVFCRVCGTKLPLPQSSMPTNIQNNLQNNTQIQSGVNTQNSINNEYLIDAYIGKNAESLKNGSFSINTFFFGTLYVLYRKMWLLGIIWLAISLISNIFLSSIASAITLATNIIISVQFKKLYLKHVKEQVEKIKSANQGKSQEQLIMICGQKGGTTLIPVIIATIFYFIVFFILFIAELYNLDSTSAEINELSFVIPSILKEDSYSTDNYKSYSTSSDGDHCTLTLLTTNSNYYNDDAKSYLENNIYYSTTDSYSGLTEKNINSNNWYMASVTSNYNKKYYYATSKNGKLYKVEFIISENSNKTCSSAYDTVINSLDFN